MEQPNSATKIIYNGEIVLKGEDREIVLDGTITNLFLNKYKIRLEGTIREDDGFRSIFENLLGEYKLFAGEYIGKVDIHTTKGNLIYGLVNRDLTSEIVSMDNLTLDLINFIEVENESRIRKDNEQSGIAQLKSEGWVIEFKRVKNYKDVYEDLKEFGGFSVTHHVSLYREDRTKFNYQETNEILENLFSYFSFICGRRIYPSEYRGSVKGDKVFSRYESKIIDSWQTLNTWYPKNEKLLKQDLFDGFNTLWSGPEWSKSKNVLLGTYLECFVPVTLENKITSIQIALEVTSRIYLVEYTKEFSNKKYKDGNFADLAKLMSKSMEIELGQPTEYLNRVTDIEDDPIIFFVKVRNSIVHSKRKIELNNENLLAAYYIGIWLLELSLLRLFSYEGRYKNRLSVNKWHGDSEFGGSYFIVPWRNESK